MIGRKHIKSARALLDLNQPQLAELCGISFSTLKRIEGPSEKGINLQNLIKIESTLIKNGIRFVENEREIGVTLLK